MNIYFFAFLFALAGCASLYFSSPHQRGLARPWPPRLARVGGGWLLAGSLGLFGQTMQGAAAVFVWGHWVMTLCVLFPYLGALFALRRGEWRK